MEAFAERPDSVAVEQAFETVEAQRFKVRRRGPRRMERPAMVARIAHAELAACLRSAKKDPDTRSTFRRRGIAWVRFFRAGIELTTHAAFP
eukprot:365697-Chlamydomonas_euryale.AAC.1